MKALVSTIEPKMDWYGNNGYRIAQVTPDDQVFPVATALFWTDCPDDCVADLWWYYNGVCEIMQKDPPEQET